MRLVVLAALLASCETPAPSLRFSVTDGVTQSCQTTDCADVPLSCDTWLSIRIIDPAEPTAPFLSQCEQVPPQGTRDLCSIGRINLDDTPLPIRDLEVQIALYPESMITRDPNTLEYICPSETQYDAVNGFPVEGEMAPAIGGRAFYRPGDETVTVSLGCTNLELVNDPTCVGLATVQVRASVDDFDTGFTVGQGEADQLSVQVGEPRSSNLMYELNPGDVTALTRTNLFPPAWGTKVELFTTYACLAVLDDAPQSTTTLVCRTATVVEDDLTFTGVRLSRTSLDQILRTIALTQVPPQGLTIGLVLDRDGDPLGNQTVTVPTGVTVQYLSSDRNSLVPNRTAAGPLGGVFVSTDAPFGTTFTTSAGMPNEIQTALGGRISNKVTIVVLKFAGPVIGSGG